MHLLAVNRAAVSVLRTSCIILRRWCFFFICFDPIICNNDNVVCVNKKSMVLGLGMHVFGLATCSVFSRFYK